MTCLLSISLRTSLAAWATFRCKILYLRVKKSNPWLWPIWNKGRGIFSKFKFSILEDFFSLKPRHSLFFMKVLNNQLKDIWRYIYLQVLFCLNHMRLSESFHWTNYLSDQLPIGPTDFPFNWPTSRWTNWLPDGPSNFQCNQPTFCLTDQLSLELSDRKLDQGTFSPTDQHTNFPLDLPTSNPTTRLPVQPTDLLLDQLTAQLTDRLPI